MNHPTPIRRFGRTGSARGFTLVELVTAASLMTIMMLSVVQIFRIVTDAAGNAEAVHFAQEQMRCFFDRLHSEIGGYSREGYLRIQITKAPHTTSGPYSANTLAFTTVGTFQGCWPATKAVRANAAEVVYTSQVLTHLKMLEVVTPSKTLVVDARRGILARGEWLITGTAGGASLDTEDKSVAPFLADLAPTGIYQDRVAKAGQGGGLAAGYVRVWPWTSLAGSSEYPASLRRVMASCVSEFYVEYLNPANDKFENSLNREFRPAYGLATVTNPGPKAIRVTVALHDPTDRSAVQGSARLTGYAMQETFWITDP